MSHKTRADLFRKISEYRGRPLIAYVTSPRPQGGGQMSGDAIGEFTRHLKLLPSDGDAIDVLIVSNGGDPIVSWRVVSLLRERYRKLGVLLPYTAYSAATLLALGADEIVMHPYSHLGPVDPQLTSQRQLPGQQVPQRMQFGSEDLRNFLDFTKADVGISDQSQLQQAFSHLVQEVGALQIGVAKRSAQLALSLGEKLLSLHMKDKSKVKAIAESLNTSFYHHGYPVGRAEAKKIGLRITNPRPELEESMWAVWEDFEQEMQCGKPFDPMMEVMESDKARAVLLAPATQVDMPSNLAPEVAQQVLQQVLSKSVGVQQVPPVESETFNAAIETEVASSQYRTRYTIQAARGANLLINVNTMVTGHGWTFELRKASRRRE